MSGSFERWADETATTALLVRAEGRTVVEIDRPARGPGWIGLDGQVRLGDATDGFGLPFEPLPDGRMRHDVASAQKSVVAVLVAIAGDRGLIDLDDPVSDHLGPGWSQASPEQEAAVSIRHLMTVTSGLDDRLEYQVPPGTRWRYSLGPAWHLLKPVLAAASGESLDALTRGWLTGPLAMDETEWIPRPGMAYLDGTPFEALLTSARDLSRFGQLVLDRGRIDDTEVVSTESLTRLLTPSQDLNPAYGLLWWLNGRRPHLVPMVDEPVEDVLLPDAPPDTVLALGAMGQICAIAPSRSVVVVRLGGSTSGLMGGSMANDLWPMLDEVLPT